MNYFANQMDPRTGQPIPQLRQGQGQAPPPIIDQQGQPWYNNLGATLMGVAEDPRNAWIGAGPIGMATKIPRAAKAIGGAVGNLREIIDEIAHDNYTAGYRKVHALLKERGVQATERQVRDALKERD